MIIDTLMLMESFFQDNKVGLEKFLQENSITAQLYKKIVSDISQSVVKTYSSASTVVQMDLDGNIIFSTGDAKFADTKEEIKKMPGSITKIDKKTILVGDVKNKKASLWTKKYTEIVAIDTENIDLTKIIGEVFNNIDATLSSYNLIWEYSSDRFVNCFKITIPDISISITDGSSDPNSITVRKNSTITWINNSTAPIYVYSGKTTSELFAENPDLSLYGQEFVSPVINVGDSWSTTLYTYGTKDWFIYPSIVTGKITVNEQPIYDYDTFLISENDGLDYPFSSRIIKVNYNKEIVWSFGNGYLVRPRKAIPLNNNKVLIST